jgi:DNA-binding transcriptional ArsR family regulator
MNIARRGRPGIDLWVALADPTRRALVERLARGELRVTDLAAPFDISLNSVSKHVKVLEAARLVRRRRVGREHFICLRPQPLHTAQGWLARQQRSGRVERHLG